MGMKGQVAKGALWVSGARLFTNTFAFFSTIILARILMPEDFGLVALATTMLLILSSVTDLSLSQALIHHEDPKEDHFHTAFTLNFGRALAIGTIFAIAAWPAGAFYHDNRLPNVMLALGLSALLTGLTNPRLVILNRDLQFHQEFIINVAQRLGGFIVTVAVGYIYRSYWALVVGSIVSPAISVILSYALISYRPKIRLTYARELWSFSAWLSLAQIVGTANAKFDNLVIGTYLGRSSLGYYSVGDNLSTIPTRETTLPLVKTLFPALARVRDDITRLRHAYQSAQTLVSAITVPAGIGLALVADPLVRLFMGEKWLPAVMVIQVLSPSFALQTIGSNIQPLVMARGATKKLFIRDSISLSLRIPSMIAGAVLGGFIGVVYARAISGTLMVVFNLHLVRELIGVSIADQIFANRRTFISAAVMATVVLVFQALFLFGGSIYMLTLKVIFSSMIGMIIYLVVYWLLWRRAGRPNGPEIHFIHMLQNVARRLKR